jgi:chromosomal replication initiation ATPase DnaA
VVNTNVRELEWALNIVMTRKILLWNTITPAHVRDALATLGFEAPVPVDTNTVWATVPHYTSLEALKSNQSWWPKKFDHVVDILCEEFDLQKEFLLWKKRTKEYSRVRQLGMFIAKQHYHWSLQKIGDYFWGKNHASVIYAIRQSQELMKNDERIKSVYTSLWL